MLNWVTDFGIVDLTFEPAGPAVGFPAWNRSATTEEIADGLRIRVASIDDIVASTQAANREKDRRALPYLASLRDARGSADEADPQRS